MRIIAGSARGITLKTPGGMHTRPTTERVKESLFSAIQFEIAGRQVLDLFAGSGQLGLEALSRGASEAVFVDADKKAFKILSENIRRSGFQEKASLRCEDSLSYLRKCGKKFNLVFLDPPYQSSFLQDAVKLMFEFDIFLPNAIIVAEYSKGNKPDFSDYGLIPSKEYGFGAAAVTVFRKE